MPTTTARERLSVGAGLCIDVTNDWTFSCVLSSNDCDGGMDNFQSSYELSSLTVDRDGSCNSNKRFQRVNIGQCKSSNSNTMNYCSSVKELCTITTDDIWVPFSTDCSVMNTETDDNPVKTKYGSCISNNVPTNTCLWSDDACDDKETFTVNDDCTCDKVRVGGCRRRNDDIIYCAVNEQACDVDSEWLSVLDLQRTADKDCYLCPRDPSSVTSELTTVPTTMSPTAKLVEITATKSPSSSAPISMSPASSSLLSSDHHHHNNNKNGLILLIFGTSILIISSLIFVTRTIINKRNNEHRRDKYNNKSSRRDNNGQGPSGVIS